MKAFYQVMSVLVVALSLAACAKKESNNKIRTNGARTDQNASFANCSNGSSSAGQVYDDGTQGGSFRDRVLALVSATIAPDNFGEISGTPNANTGVDFRLRMKADGSGRPTGDSRVQLVIYDSYVGTKDSAGQEIRPYPITISGNASGTINQSSRQFDVTFEDGYGRIRVTGNWDGSQARGTVSFVNSKHVSGGAPASGTLGAFILPACGLFL